MGFSCVSASYILHWEQSTPCAKVFYQIACIGMCWLYEVHSTPCARFSILLRVSKRVGSMRRECMCVCVRARVGVESRDSIPTSAMVWSRLK